jgi:tight adherence protein B
MRSLVGVALIAIGLGYLALSTALPVLQARTTDPYARFTGGPEVGPRSYRSFLQPLSKLLPRRLVGFYRNPLDVGNIFHWSVFLDRQLAFLLVSLGIGLAAVSDPVLIVALGLVGPAVHYMMVRRRARAYSAQFLLQLPNALLLIGSAMAAGRNFVNALDATTPNIGEPLRTELGALAQQIRSLQIDEAQAFQLWADRLPYPELHTTASALAIGNRAGIETFVLLRNISDAIQAEIRGRQELDAVTSSVRSSAAVVSSLPFAFLLLIYFVTPGFVRPLFTTIGGGAALIAVIGLNMGSRVVIRQMLERIDL